MEASEEALELGDDEFPDDFCIARSECVKPLIADALADCIYCQLGRLDDEGMD